MELDDKMKCLELFERFVQAIEKIVTTTCETHEIVKRSHLASIEASNSTVKTNQELVEIRRSELG